MISAIIIYVSVVMVMSIICFVAYGLDKQLAVDGSRRVSEGSPHQIHRLLRLSSKRWTPCFGLPSPALASCVVFT